MQKYLEAYQQVLKNKPYTRYYIDAFAGTGDRTDSRVAGQTLFELPELDEMTKGSARVALEIEPPFDNYVFIEKRKQWSSALEGLKTEFPSRNISVLNEDANDAIQRICRTTDWRRNRTALFLDPYGMQVSWDALVAVAGTRAVDVWVLYPSGMGMNRLLTNSGEIPVEWENTLDRFVGSRDWRTTFYREVTSTNLLGETAVDRVKDAGTDKFEAFFLDRLRTIFTGVAPRGVPLRNTRGQVMYLLCFACGNAYAAKVALRIANAVMKPRRR